VADAALINRRLSVNRRKMYLSENFHLKIQNLRLKTPIGRKFEVKI